MPGPTTELLDSDVKVLRVDIHKVTLEVARFSAEFNVFRWLLGLTLIAMLGGIGSGIWWAAKISANVKNTETRLDKFEGNINTRLDKMDARLDKLDGRMDRIEARLDRMEALLLKVIEKNGAVGKVEAR